MKIERVLPQELKNQMADLSRLVALENKFNENLRKRKLYIDEMYELGITIDEDLLPPLLEERLDKKAYEEFMATAEKLKKTKI